MPGTSIPGNTTGNGVNISEESLPWDTSRLLPSSVMACGMECARPPGSSIGFQALCDHYIGQSSCSLNEKSLCLT